MNGIQPDEAVHKLDILYSNPKYSQLELGQALQLLLAQINGNASNSSEPGSGSVTPPK
jgi:hypothetical protein